MKRVPDGDHTRPNDDQVIAAFVITGAPFTKLNHHLDDAMLIMDKYLYQHKTMEYKYISIR